MLGVNATIQVSIAMSFLLCVAKGWDKGTNFSRHSEAMTEGRAFALARSLLFVIEQESDGSLSLGGYATHSIKAYLDSSRQIDIENVSSSCQKTSYIGGFQNHHCPFYHISSTYLQRYFCLFATIRQKDGSHCSESHYLSLLKSK